MYSEPTQLRRQKTFSIMSEMIWRSNSYSLVDYQDTTSVFEILSGTIWVALCRLGLIEGLVLIVVWDIWWFVLVCFPWIKWLWNSSLSLHRTPHKLQQSGSECIWAPIWIPNVIWKYIISLWVIIEFQWCVRARSS